MAKINDVSANCLIGEGSVFEGKFYVSGPILIEGKFQGDIKTDDQVVIGSSGRVKTNINAKKITISGTVIGNITASEEVNLLSSGKVLGNITTPRLNVEPGVVSSGEVKIVSDSGKSINDIINDSFGEDASLFLKNLSPAPKKSGKTENDKN